MDKLCLICNDVIEVADDFEHEIVCEFCKDYVTKTTGEIIGDFTDFAKTVNDFIVENKLTVQWDTYFPKTDIGKKMRFKNFITEIINEHQGMYRHGHEG